MYVYSGLVVSSEDNVRAMIHQSFIEVLSYLTQSHGVFACEQKNDTSATAVHSKQQRPSLKDIRSSSKITGPAQ